MINETSTATPARDITTRQYGNYRFRAVVDWIRVKIVTQQPTNFDTVRRRMEVPFATPIDEGAGKAATEFTVTIQDPTSWADIEETIAKLTHDHPLAVPVEVIGIELSMDAYSRTNNREELVDMVARFYKYSTVIVSGNRRTSGKGKHSSQGIETFRGLRNRIQDGFNIYIGSITDPTYQHMYLKETNKKDNVVENLPDSERRARSEFTFSGNDLQHSSLADWHEHDFTSEARCFKYRKLRQNLSPYARAGVMHLAQIGEKKARRRSVGGTRLYSVSTLADTKMNALTYSALRELTKRMQG